MDDRSAAGPVIEAIPEGDNRTRKVCPDCGYIEYDNPKIVVGAVCMWGEEVLLCRRAIEPRMGYWTIPAGFMELNETTSEGAIREVWEEARATVRVRDMLGIYEIPLIGHVYVVFRAELVTPDCAPGPESLDVGLFPWERIPWGQLAFPSIAWALEHFHDRDGPLCHTAQWEPWE